MEKKKAVIFENIKVDVRFKLLALWCSVLFFYIYGDYFELYQPGKLQGMIAGRTAAGDISQEVLLGMSAIMIIPSLMPFLSLALPARVSRWVNIGAGALYTVIMMLVILGGRHFYVVFGLIEIALTLLIVWHAWSWPKERAA